MLKNFLKKLLFINIFKKVFGLKGYETLKHTIRYYSPIVLNYPFVKEISFGSQKANDFFKSELFKSKFYLEYGSGCSSVLASKMHKDFYSIEGDKNFYKFMISKVSKKNIKFRSLGIVKENSIPIHSLSDLKNVSLSDKQRSRIRDYCSAIFELSNEKGLAPDLILVDGRYRVLCGLYLYKFFKENNQNFKIIFDDFNTNKNYHELNHFFEIEIFERFGITTKIKENNNLENSIERNYFDHR